MREEFAGFVQSSWLGRSFVDHPVVPVPTSYEELKETAGAEGDTWPHPDTGVLYYYSEAVSKWLRDEAYDLTDATVELKGKIDGDVLPANETPVAWSDFATGSIATDGVEVTWDTVGQGVAAASSSLLTGMVDSIHACFCEGYFDVPAVEGTDSRLRCQLALTLASNGKRVDLNLAYQDNKLRLVNGSNTPIGTAHADVNLVGSARRFLQFLVDPDGTCYLWVGHADSPTLSVAFSSLDASSGTGLSIGTSDNDSGDNATIAVSQFQFFKLSETP